MALADLLKQKANLELQIASARADSRSKAIAEARTLMAEHGLAATDIAPARDSRGKTAGVARGRVPVKFKDGQGNTWSGRGLKPKWLTAALAAGGKIEDYAA